jgi:hypothetical protein
MFVKLTKVNIRSGAMAPDVRIKYENIDYFCGVSEIIGSGTPPTFMDLTYIAMGENFLYVLETPDEVEQVIRREILKYEEQ